MKKGQIISVEMEIKDHPSRFVRGKVIEVTESTVWIIIGDTIKLHFEFPSGNQIISGVTSQTKRLCRVSSWEGFIQHEPSV